MDAELVGEGKAFTRKAEGQMRLIVDEDSGNDNGGGTNTEGYYTTALFNGTEIFPPGVCEKVPGSDGSSPRCLDDPASMALAGLTTSFMLGPRDAVVFVGCTPPPVKYFSWDAIVDVRMVPGPEVFYPGMNFGDDINGRHIARHLHLQDDEVFDRPVMVAHTADGASQSQVEGVLARVSAAASADIWPFTRAMSSDTVRMWDRSGGKHGENWEDTDPDILSIIGRITSPLPGRADSFDAYKKHAWPMRMYFAADEYALPAEPLDAPLIPRDNAAVMDEYVVLGPTVMQLQQAVNMSWLAGTRYRGPDGGVAKFDGVQGLNMTLEGYYDNWDTIFDMANNDSFIAGTRDAAYGIPTGELVTSWNYATNFAGTIYGVLHEDSIGAAYHSVGIGLYNGTNSAFGLYGNVWEQWWLNDALRGSARRYLDSSLTAYDAAAADMLYAIDVLPPGGCTAAPEPKWCVEVDTTTLGESVRRPYWGISSRIYSLDSTGVGAPVEKTIQDQFLVYRF
jgi:hypothetical protein